ncbi:50S ribosomal protein L18 [Candidatus Gottesmanbacteria bacterium]|nr:50S ribosomal protein L18 [Candidatus Gottesmanbacteria bacterium]
MKSPRQKKQIRKIRIRSKIKGTKNRPRISVFRSNKYISAQAIDDVKQITLASISTTQKKGKKIDTARQAGKMLAEKILKLKNKEAIFDRNGYKYHGRIKAFVEGLREGGLKV